MQAELPQTSLLKMKASSLKVILKIFINNFRFIRILSSFQGWLGYFGFYFTKSYREGYILNVGLAVFLSFIPFAFCGHLLKCHESRLFSFFFFFIQKYETFVTKHDFEYLSSCQFRGVETGIKLTIPNPRIGAVSSFGTSGNKGCRQKCLASSCFILLALLAIK